MYVYDSRVLYKWKDISSIKKISAKNGENTGTDNLLNKINSL